MWAGSRVTHLLLLVTFGATLVLPLEWAIFTGVGLGIAHHLAAGRCPRLQLPAPVGDRLLVSRWSTTATSRNPRYSSTARFPHLPFEALISGAVAEDPDLDAGAW
jgi:hypothetical protein